MLSKDEPEGFLASQYKFIEVFQSEMGIVSSKLDSIDKKIDLLKKETSDDPRKELANRGVEWHPGAFREMLKLGDLENAELFLRGGMDIALTDKYGPYPTAIELVKDKTKDYEKVFLFLIENGLDINSTKYVFNHRNWHSFKNIDYTFVCDYGKKIYKEYSLSIANYIAIEIPIEDGVYDILKKYNANFDDAIKIIEEYMVYLDDNCVQLNGNAFHKKEELKKDILQLNLEAQKLEKEWRYYLDNKINSETLAAVFREYINNSSSVSDKIRDLEGELNFEHEFCKKDIVNTYAMLENKLKFLRSISSKN